MCYCLNFFPTEASDVCETESVASTCPESVSSTCAESDNTAGIIAGVVAVALITALTVIVIVVLVLRTFRGNSKTRYNIYSREVYSIYVHYYNCAGKGLMYLQLLTRQ